MLAVLFAYVAWCGYPDRDPREEETTGEVTRHPGQDHSLPPILLLVFAGSLLWLVAYAIVRGIFGGAIT